MRVAKARSKCFRQQRGVALLIVMLIMALMTTVSATMSSRMFANFNRVESQLHHQQAYWFALSAEGLAEAVLKSSFGTNEAVTLSQDWAVRDRMFPIIDGWQLKGSVFDEQACFNLNGLSNISSPEYGSNPAAVKMLQRLIESQGLDSSLAETAASSTWEYIDENTNVQSSAGFEDSEYESREIPHVAANGLISDVTEWRAVNGVSREMYQKVAPFLCANPSKNLIININTLEEKDAALLAAILDPHLSEDQARDMIRDRDPVNGWQDLNSFFADPIFAELTNTNKTDFKKYLDIKSRFFETDIDITLNENHLRVRSLLQLDDGGKMKVVRRRFGGTSDRNTGNTSE